VIEGKIFGRCRVQVVKVFNLLRNNCILGKTSILALREALRGYRDHLFQKVKDDRKDKFGNWNLIPTYEKIISETIHDTDFDLIYTTGGAATVHIAVAHALEGMHIPWIAEIQDPLLFEDIDGPTYKPSKRDLDYLYLAEECLKKADAVVCVTETCAEHYRDRLGKRSVHSIYPGSNVHSTPNEKPKSTEQTPGTISIFHGGTLAGDRNLEVLVRAIRDQDLEEAVSLTIAGYIDNEVRRQISDLPFIRYLGVVSRDETRRQISHSDVCLVVQNRSSVSKYTIPSKFYEYASLSIPILFLGYDNDEARKNSSIYNFYYCDQRNLAEVTECLQQVVSDYRSGRVRIPRGPKITTATDQFVKLCRELTRGSSQNSCSGRGTYRT